MSPDSFRGLGAQPEECHGDQTDDPYPKIWTKRFKIKLESNIECKRDSSVSQTMRWKKMLHQFFTVCSYICQDASVRKQVFWSSSYATTCLLSVQPLNGRDIPLSALPMDMTSELAGLFFTISLSAERQMQEAINTHNR